MTRGRVLVVIGIVFAFVMGAFFGAMATRERYWRRWAPQERHERMLEMFSRKLDLSPEQKEQVAKILEDGRQQMRSLREQVQPQFKALRSQTHEQIRAVLNPEQVAKFNAIQEKFAKRREHFMKRKWDAKE